MVTETRKLGDGLNTLVVYTESQDVRRALKKLPAFEFETTYHAGSMGPVVAVDVYLTNGDLPSLKLTIDKTLSGVID